MYDANFQGTDADREHAEAESRRLRRELEDRCRSLEMEKQAHVADYDRQLSQHVAELKASYLRTEAAVREREQLEARHKERFLVRCLEFFENKRGDFAEVGQHRLEVSKNRLQRRLWWRGDEEYRLDAGHVNSFGSFASQHAQALLSSLLYSKDLEKRPGKRIKMKSSPSSPP